MKWRKYIAVFLAAYMLVLLCMPCKDNCNTSQHKIPSTYAAAQDHHHDENDQCSPFCFCACCATSITVVAFPNLEFSLQINIEKFSVYNSSFVSEVNSSIWQPPKIG